MLSIYSERIPAELIAMAKTKGVSPNDMDVEIEDNRQAAGDFVKPPEPAYRAFGGAGSTSGAAAPLSASAVFGKTDTSSPVMAPFDSSAPSTTIQVKLVNGKRLLVELNYLTHTVSDLVSRVSTENATGGKPFILKAGFPPKPIDSLNQTIETAGLKNASVQQFLA